MKVPFRQGNAYINVGYWNAHGTIVGDFGCQSLPGLLRRTLDRNPIPSSLAPGIDTQPAAS